MQSSLSSSLMLILIQGSIHWSALKSLSYNTIQRPNKEAEKGRSKTSGSRRSKRIESEKDIK